MNTKSDLTAHSTGLLQGTAYSRLHANLTEILVPFNLSIPEWKLLGQLYDNGNIRLNVLSELLSYDPPMVTKLAKQLEKKQLLRREIDPTDERAKIIALTPSASKLLKQIDPIVKKRLGNMLKGITQEELKIYIKVLNVIVNNTG
ncbi:MAG TPA: MarR family transcriptional regulator [Candidatus Saccharimonadales bacterium]|nr:MarR family transcriptional regulator [Candidatus Saccharimonadales bacterium]